MARKLGKQAKAIAIKQDKALTTLKWLFAAAGIAAAIALAGAAHATVNPDAGGTPVISEPAAGTG